MEIKNYYLKDSKTFFESIIKVLICFGIDYVLINKNDILELHFDNYIFRGYSYDKNINKQNTSDEQRFSTGIVAEKLKILKISRFLKENPDMISLLSNDEFSDNIENYLNFKPKYQDDKVKNTGYKVLTKKDFKNDKNNYRVKNRYVGAKLPIR